MNFDGFDFEKLTWKKIAVVALSAFIGMMLMREVFVLIFLNSARNMVSQFNQDFEKGQDFIHNKIEEGEIDFQKRGVIFNRIQENIAKDVDDIHADFQKMFDERDKRRAEEEKELAIWKSKHKKGDNYYEDPR